VFGAINARFYWEMSWEVHLESTGSVYRGDFSTEMMFNFNKTTMEFEYYDGQNLVNIDETTSTERCFRCTKIETKNWKLLQLTTGTSFVPLLATGAPYYLSDKEGRFLYAMGKVCNGEVQYRCYLNVPDGIYLLRLG